ncbi:retinoblastoma-related protein 2 [Zea mays]|uniref:Retinoblastoma-related protein 2 n=1 Tax=Zea mays TaxID=4577 RepID=K7U7B5_MAIZE|nr:retinoblastoma-related protein 2 [Zea mays]AQK57623.1 Retinoblastoma-related protein 2 [Zea mays]AQK57624.1 Retinoblastoma-related protein 2 [Zea mays]AQK57634.1 Retinoblastoma-related protein 2 [Zea mays]AQK57649.1 Retinoblastoma-related protein 2 [Zea mays]AQK57651.1 Retinoblastoma-related protein 2 [Zea mays]|eukprot:XP_008679464.1 retinoblastoma-related protein 2 isoform X2 [Zea mays]
MSSQDPPPATSTQKKQSESLVNLLAEASRFYRKAYNELFSGLITEWEPESSTNTPDYMLFGWHLFLTLRSRSPELFKDLVSCIHGLVAVLAILLVHVPAKFRTFTIEGSSHLIKQTEKGVDLIASLCHNYHTSEECLKEMMDKSHKAIEEVFSMKALSASECKTENLDKIDTDRLMYFKGLIDMECFQSNLEKMEKLCNSNNCEAELDFKLILTNNDYIPCAENLSRDSTNLGCSKCAFETLASPTKTIKNMLTVPSSPLSPTNGGSVKIVQMTPITSAMTTAKWLREVISSLPEKPSSKLQQLMSSCDRDLTNAVTERVSIVLEAIFPTKSSADRGGSLGLNCANAFDTLWADARKMEASKLYYRVLEAICRAELQNSNVNNLTPLLSNERFHRCLIACSAELVLATHKTVIMMFPAVLESTGLTSFDLSKIIENFVRHEETLPRELKRHLNSLEEQILESMAWEKGSSLYNSLIVARPSVASEINRFGLLAESMPSLDDLVARQNIHIEGLPATPSKKRAAGRDDNADPRSPKRPCNESRSTVVEHNLQTPPPKQCHMVLTSLKAKCHPLQSTFASPTVSNPVGGNEKCADVTIQIFFSKILKLAAIRIRNLCERIQYMEQTERVYNVFKQILDQQTTLFFNRHIDQLILCCLYGVAKVCQLELSFREILNNYKKEAQCKPEVFLSIYIGSRNHNGVLISRHVDIITFYNEVFVPAAKPFLVSLISSGTRPEDKKNASGQVPGSPKLSPFPNLPDMSPKKVSASHNVYVSPLRQTKMDLLLSPSSRSFYACIGEGTHAYQSPSKDLAAINSRLNYNGRRVNSRLNFDMVSDSVVAGSLGQPNGGSTSLDPAAAFSPLSKRKPDT